MYGLGRIAPVICLNIYLAVLFPNGNIYEQEMEERLSTIDNSMMSLLEGSPDNRLKDRVDQLRRTIQVIYFCHLI